ncbi:hypothetical protein [Flagellimonas pacifica]|uniref:Glycosyltransferase n=1 Tax=Flagellimonas pacifica TaxID=1247520 RepID=A0A285MSW9_9FLAO|nr:hypothetical protein [Allomuricauda parva]SNY99637.1 hypothetical protein SAMN06265377_1448 [Allomuricauda parva]
MKSTLIVLAQSLEQPRIVKRISQKTKEYKSIYVYGFTRNVHSIENHEVIGGNQQVTIKIAGQLKNGKYLERIFTYLKLLIIIYKKHGFSKKNVYVFGLDLRIFSSFLFNSQIDYEISDIVWLYHGKTKRNILRYVDNLLARKSRKVVFTTRSFYKGYYDKVKEDKVLIEENKLETYGKVKPIEKVKSDKVRIAYIGAFRYPKIIENLLLTVSENKNLILNFYGATHGELIKKIDKATMSNTNIFYHGPFKNPDHLERIYSDNNLNFVVYDNLLENEKVAMPNKFYESGFFNIPIVCATNTYVGQRVLQNKMGWTIDTDYKSISNFLNHISIEELIEYHQEIKTIDKSHFIT